MSSEINWRFCRAGGHITLDDALAKPLTIAVLPTPGSRSAHRVVLVRRLRIWMVRGFLIAADQTGSACPRAPPW